MTASGIKQSMAHTVKEVGSRLDSVFDELERLKPQAQQLLNGNGAQQAARTDLRALKEPLLDVARRGHGLVDGTGIAVAPGTLRDSAMWLEWWRISPDGAEQFAGHSFDQMSIGFYDYTEMSWFRLPNESNEPAAVGPYLDNGGTDFRVVTLSIPLGPQGAGRAVIAADLSLAALEVLLLREMGPDSLVALVTRTGKIIASNSSRHAGGLLLGKEVLERSPIQLDVPTKDLRRFDWLLAAV